jgi:hypothetical protein
MTTHDKRWAIQADELEFEQVENVRASASKWRDGLIALTALLTAVTIVKGPDKAGDLSADGRMLVAAVLALALIVLLLGAGLAMRASYGFPPKAKLMTGQRLKAWSRGEASVARRLLFWAQSAFFGGVLLVAVAIGLTWFDQDLFKKAPAAYLNLDVQLAGDQQPITVCGKIVASRTTGVSLEVKGSNGPRTKAYPYTAIRSIGVVEKCAKPM